MNDNPNAVTMSSKDFMKWSDGVIDDILRATMAKKAVDKLTLPFWNWSQRNSLYPLHFGLACCALEMAASAGPRWDTERLGIIYRSSPRQSDVLLLNGWISKKVRPVLRRLYEQMPAPKWVIAMGECSISGGPWYDCYNIIQGGDTFLPVDIYIPGCPPRPEALIDGFLKLQKKIKAEGKGPFLED